MDPVGAALARQHLQVRDRLARHRVQWRQHHLELIDHYHDPRPPGTAPRRPQAAQVPGSDGPHGKGPALHQGTDVPQHGDPELPVAVHSDRVRVWQHERVVTAGSELGELQTLLEVEQVESQLVGGITGRQAIHHIKQQGRFARSGLPTDQRVDGVVVEPQRHRAVRAERHRNSKTAGGVEAPQRLG